MNKRIFPRVVLQDSDSSLDFQAMDEWTRDPTVAAKLWQPASAADFVRLANLANLNVVSHPRGHKQEYRFSLFATCHKGL